MYKNKLLVILFIAFVYNINAQDTLVPIRYKNKFGLSNLAKEVKVKPIYDKMVFNNRTNYFIGFKKTESNAFSTTLFHNDKALIKDKPYFDYSIHEGLIVAADTTSQKTVIYHNVHYNEKMQLYSLEGILLSPKFYAFIAVLDNLGDIKPTSEVFVIFKGLDDKHSFKLYDLKLQKFTKTFLEDVDGFNIINNEKIYWVLESMKLSYTKGAIFGKMEIKLVDGSFSIVSDIKSEIKKPEKDNGYFDNDDNIEVPEFNEKPKPVIKSLKGDSLSETLQQVRIATNHKDFIDTDFLVFEDHWYYKKNYSLVHNSGKVGVLNKDKDKYEVPTEYDAVYRVNYYNAFVIKKDNKYGLIFPQSKEIIKPIFDDFPVVVKQIFRGKGYNLIALFDTETLKFKHYATFDGVQFFIE